LDWGSWMIIEENRKSKNDDVNEIRQEEMSKGR
jgi:hypothetical protein